jgi:hypothetical protein
MKLNYTNTEDMKNYRKILVALFLVLLTSLCAKAQDTVVAWHFPLNPDNAVADGGSAANLSQTIGVRGGTSVVDFANIGFTTNAANATGWDNGSGTKYWMISVVTTGYTSLNISSKQRSNNTGPRDFKLQYTLDTTGTWTDIPSGSISVLNNWTSGFVNNLALPAGCTNQSKVYIRWIMTSNTSATGGVTGSSGTSKIDDILITGGTSYAPVYATLPYAYTFESVWINGNDTTDVPSVNWLNTPAGGNNSWRRDDDVASWNSSNGTYTPGGALSSLHSARFHTWDAPAGSSGTLDLYVNCSNPGTKSLSFYYLNTSGTDHITVFFSTDGGSTFLAKDSVFMSAAWAKYTINLGSTTSATCIVRFKATSDWGVTDIGLDNVEVGPPAALDAGIAQISAPASVITAGTKAVKADLQNFGTNLLTTVQIHWSVNGVAQSTYNWVGSLASGAIDDSVNLGNYTFSSGSYLIEAWTQSPNSGVDAELMNDTARKTVVVTSWASMPFLETFDGAWINKNDTLDVPAAYWNNTPAFGNQSWRRDDEGDSGDWTASTAAVYTPAGAQTTSHSARFHTYYASAGSQGILDLNINLSTAGNKSLTYYYINTDGTDQLQVLLSTDGGGTFTLLNTSGLASVWTKYVVSLGSITPANAVIRFAALSDFGYTDIGLDQVAVDFASHDVSLQAIVLPNTDCGLSAAETVSVVIKNSGALTETNIPLSFKADAVVHSETYTGTLTPGSSAVYTFTNTANFASYGAHHLTVYSALSTDTYRDNDTVTATIVNLQDIASFPFFMNFETASYYLGLHDTLNSLAVIKDFAGNGGSRGLRLTGGQQGVWAAGTGTSTTHHEAWDVYTEHQSRAFTCNVDASSLSSPELKFDLFQTNTAGNLYSWFRVMLNDTVQLSDTAGVSDFNPVTYNSDPWVTHVFDLSAWAGSDFTLSFQASCKYDSTFDGWGDAAYIDNILIRNKPANDISMLSWLAPLGGSCDMGSSDSITVMFRNSGINTITDIPLAYSINNGSSWVYDTAFITMNPGDTAVFTFSQPANFSATGAYPCIARINLGNDDDPMNDSIHMVINSVPYISVFPYAQNFENAFTGWTIGGTGVNCWEKGSPAKVQLSGAHSGSQAWVTKLSGDYPIDADCWIMSPCLDFSSLSDPQLSVWLNLNTEDSWDAMIMETSVNDSAWVQYNSDTTFYNNFNDWGSIAAPKWSGSNGGWVQYKTAMTAFAGLDNVKIRFRFISDNSIVNEGVALDDIFISDPIPYNASAVALLSPESGCGLSNAEMLSIRIGNTGTQPISNITVSYSVDGGSWISETASPVISPGNTGVYNFTTPANFSGAGTHNCEIAVHMATDPDYTNDTLMVSVHNFTAISSIPYYEDFESGNNSFDFEYGSNAMVGISNAVGEGGSYALHFTGGTGGSWPGGTGTNTTSSEAWDFYTDHVAKATTCDINVSGAQHLFLSFMLRQTQSNGGPMYSWFRMMANGTALMSDTMGRSEFHPYTESFDSSYLVVYDLTALIGTTFKISLQASNKYDAANSPNFMGDNVYIDNLALFDSGASSINEEAGSIPLIFPNPATSELFISFGDPNSSGSYRIFDVRGALMMSDEWKNTTAIRIDISTLPKGMYCIMLNRGNKVNTYKVIKE